MKVLNEMKSSEVKFYTCCGYTLKYFTKDGELYVDKNCNGVFSKTKESLVDVKKKFKEKCERKELKGKNESTKTYEVLFTENEYNKVKHLICEDDYWDAYEKEEEELTKIVLDKYGDEFRTIVESEPTFKEWASFVSYLNGYALAGRWHDESIFDRHLKSRGGDGNLEKAAEEIYKVFLDREKKNKESTYQMNGEVKSVEEAKEIKKKIIPHLRNWYKEQGKNVSVKEINNILTCKFTPGDDLGYVEDPYDDDWRHGQDTYSSFSVWCDDRKISDVVWEVFKKYVKGPMQILTDSLIKCEDAIEI